jgi:hypothetical protein
MRKGLSALFKKGWGWRLVKLRGTDLLCYDEDQRTGYVRACMHWIGGALALRGVQAAAGRGGLHWIGLEDTITAS